MKSGGLVKVNSWFFMRRWQKKRRGEKRKMATGDRRYGADFRS
jgi:hypothetical protein